MKGKANHQKFKSWRNLKVLLLCTIAVQLSLPVTGDPLKVVDDSTHAADNSRATIRIASRLQSLGYFSFGGRLVSDNPSADFYAAYNRKSWGASIFKVFDLYDHRTPNNFTLALVYKDFHVNNRMTVTPYLGILLEQLNSVADHDSDISSMLNLRFKLSKAITLEHTSLFSNLVLEKELQDWVNRFKLIYNKSNYSITWIAWHNNSVFDNSYYYSTGLSAFYNNIKLTEKLSLNSGITTHQMVYSSDENVNPKKHGILLTVAFQLENPSNPLKSK